MLKPEEFLRDIQIHPELQPSIVKWLKPWRLKTYVDILVVVDTEISTVPNVGFGIGSVIEHIRNAAVGCMRFRVDIALRSNEAFSVVANPGTGQPKYRGFRFNSVDNGVDVLDKYEQVWCFGFKPSNSGSLNDAEIDQPFALPATNSEMEKLDEWMTEKKGGVFGTGDHHFLGASMCRKIPRLGTMRRWTNADGVPPQFGPDRIDTLRPPEPVANYAAGGPSSMDNTPHQGDLAVQPIRWTTWRSVYWPFGRIRKRPHPVLCHPKLGPIDVMPDHAHEGLCVPSPDLNAIKQFNSEKEYPNAVGGGPKPRPEIIAYGSNLDSDDWNFGKGEQPGRNNNPMIAVYDGHLAGVGRVATDSTWHHWMDVNINNLKVADNNDWKKISRYFVNLAVWLNPPGFTTRCFYLAVVASHFEFPGFQEYHVGATTLELGHSLRKWLIYSHGPCWVTEHIWRVIWELDLIPRKVLFELTRKFEDTDVDPEMFEAMVLGEMIEATMNSADKLKQGNTETIRALSAPEKLFAKPIAQAVKQFARHYEKQLKTDRDNFARFKVVKRR